MTDKRMKAAANQAVSYRNYRRARDRALVRLTHAYPDTYRQLLAEEKAFDEVNGKKWVGISGSTSLVVGIHTRANGATGPIALQANAGKRENQSYNGGEA